MEDQKKQMLMALLAKRKEPKPLIEGIEVEEETDEEKLKDSDLAPEGEEIDSEEDMAMIEEPNLEDEGLNQEMMAALMGNATEEQLGSKPKGLRERAIFEMLKKQKG
jgi:hypothetical protein